MKAALLFICLLIIVSANSQTSIYDCGAYTPITQSQINNAGNEFNRPCVELDGNYNFNGSSNKLITSPTSIHILPGFKAHNYNSDGGMHLKIVPKGDFDVAIMNYTDFNSVLKYEKLEIGVELPNNILDKVNNFVNDVAVGNEEKINPYLEWELRVVAEFTKGTDAPIIVDGFYSREYTSEMVDILPEPANAGSVEFPNYNDEEYWSLGSWTQVPTVYPFLIRFAPPSLNEWKCKIKIYVGTDTYISDEFTFKVIESDNPGYMKVESGNRYLSYNNKTFVPVGCNVPWPVTNNERDPELAQYLVSQKEDGSWGNRPEDYRHYYVLPRVYDKYKEALSSLADNGANYFRTIMYPTATEIEWERLGNYTKRLHMAQEMDKILELAEEKKVFLHWDLQIHYTLQFSPAAYWKTWTWEYNSWDGHYCYRDLTAADNPSDSPTIFFTHEDAKKYYKQRLRYIMARYGYSTNIALFELFCEISNVGANTNDNADFYRTGDNWVMYRDWQVEMADYIKSQYNGAVHLVTGNYVGVKHRDDNTFESPSMDVMTSNLYDFAGPSFSNGFWNDQVAERVLNGQCSSPDSYTLKCTESGSTSNIKPMMFSESGPVEVENDCGSNNVETNRSMWQSLFSGLAGSLSWSAWNRPDNYAVFGPMSEFMSQFELGGERWHPGASDRYAYPQWIYSDQNANDMEGKKADVTYLRSGDANFAIGVLTNKTYNVFTTSDCFDGKWLAADPPIPAVLQHPIVVHTGSQDLKLKDMHVSKYYINYFYPTDLSTPFHSSDDVGPNVKLDVDIPAAQSTYIVLFMARRKNHTWMGLPDTRTAEEILNDVSIWENATIETASFEEFDEYAVDIDVYPVPSSDFITIEAEQHQGPVTVTIESMDGKIVKTLLLRSEREEVDIQDLENGTFIVKFSTNGRLLGTRKIVKI